MEENVRRHGGKKENQANTAADWHKWFVLFSLNVWKAKSHQHKRLKAKICNVYIKSVLSWIFHSWYKAQGGNAYFHAVQGFSLQLPCCCWSSLISALQGYRSRTKEKKLIIKENNYYPQDLARRAITLLSNHYHDIMFLRHGEQMRLVMENTEIQKSFSQKAFFFWSRLSLLQQ